MVNNRTDMEELFAAREHLSCELTHLWDVKREKDIKIKIRKSHHTEGKSFILQSINCIQW